MHPVAPLFRSALALTLILPPLSAQEVSGPPGPRLSVERDHELRLARSAAPASVSEQATIYIFVDGKYEVGEPGTNGNACYVSRSWPESLEPHCFDAEGARTIMRLEMHGVELAHAGVGAKQAKARFAAGLADGSFALPQRPVMSWMMSSAQVLYSDEGRRVGAWMPHVMIYYPQLEAGMLGAGAPDIAAGILVGAGTPMSNLMIVVPTAVDPTPALP